MNKQYFKYIILKLMFLISDKIMLKIMYFIKMRRFLSFSNPKGYNQAIQWLKVYNRNPLYQLLADKYKVREYVSKVIGDKYLVPMILVCDSITQVDWDHLPQKFALKCNHGSGMNIICNNKDSLNYSEIARQINIWQKIDYSIFGREWVYHKMPKKIIIEELLQDNENEGVNDYKIFCFYGKPYIIQVDFSRFKNHKRNFYDLHWNLLDLEVDYKQYLDHKHSKPQTLDSMLDLASKLTLNIPHARVDFYSLNNKIYFGEITFYPEAGYGKFSNGIYDDFMGRAIMDSDFLNSMLNKDSRI